MSYLKFQIQDSILFIKQLPSSKKKKYKSIQKKLTKEGSSLDKKGLQPCKITPIE